MAALPHYYLLILLIFAQCFLIKKIGKGPVLFLIALELWFLSAFRGWDIGNDTGNYVAAFIHMYSPFPDVFGQGHMEQGYRLFNQFVGFFSHNPQTILIVTSAVIISSRFLTIARYSAYAGFT
ncbi:MAG: EpsG family protein, partial [Elusimicrobiaceae bacterium]|nr:EpsG family protein [Elusimicrobiaceae bacterium]